MVDAATQVRLTATGQDARTLVDPSTENDPEKLREVFQDFTAGQFYGQMLKALRSTQGEAAYFHGGTAEEIFQGQMDQLIAEDLARHHGAQFSEPMFRLFESQLRHAKLAADADSLNRADSTNALSTPLTAGESQ